MQERFDVGVYAIVCDETGNAYVGSTNACFDDRWGQHLEMLDRGEGYGHEGFQEEWDIYGTERFSFNILEICQPGCWDASSIRHLEAFWINKLRQEGYCLNGRRQGEGKEPTLAEVLRTLEAARRDWNLLQSWSRNDLETDARRLFEFVAALAERISDAYRVRDRRMASLERRLELLEHGLRSLAQGRERLTETTDAE